MLPEGLKFAATSLEIQLTFELVSQSQAPGLEDIAGVVTCSQNVKTACPTTSDKISPSWPSHWVRFGSSLYPEATIRLYE